MEDGIMILRVLVLALLSPFSLSAQEVVQNGKAPIGGAWTLEFLEDLSFGGSEEDDTLLWTSSRTKIFPDQQGNMIISDPAENRILVFDEKGHFIRVIAKAGQGPGELQGIRSLTLLNDQTAILLDGPLVSMPKLKYFNDAMKMTNEVFLTKAGFVPQSMWISPDGNWAGANLARVERQSRKFHLITAVINFSELKIVHELTNYERPFLDPSKAQDAGYWAKYIAGNLKTIFDGYGVVAFGPQGIVYTAVSNQYVISIWQKDLKYKEMIIKRTFEPIANTEDHLRMIVEIMVETFGNSPTLQNVLTRGVFKKALKLADPPPLKSPVFGIIPIEPDGFLVVHDVDLASGFNLADIFDKNGQFLGQVSVDQFAFMDSDGGQFQPRMIFRNRFAYTILTDENGNNRAVRYRYQLTRL